ncbi:N-acyl homoserine lactonase family protein [Streptomyces sp. NBC_00237]|uniref:N-acyl homoserine lactonase family protein n=1 Tax=Streptomyces sp. NBC_00237 TaxID=2975687 RepID=UPI002259CAF8|nr:N-acyl homoserine lactonase family protein [Streptomyces sp. NBC_00237]MCX5202003.1 N-acyl homoserine lactonase family protein [Streptomyces sp. NBC_00237]
MNDTFAIRRLDLGHFVRPASETGTGRPRTEAVLAYLVRRPQGLLLFDTGIGRGCAETDAHYRPQRRELTDALTDAGVSPGDLSAVVNCHLHFDHIGGNPALAGLPVFVQAQELALARAGDHTIDALVDPPGPPLAYEVLDGEAEVWPGVLIVPTPGHTPGHQSLVVSGPDGATVLAGQAYDVASEYSHAELEARTGTAPAERPWLDRLAELSPQRVLFAHDRAVWTP